MKLAISSLVSVALHLSSSVQGELPRSSNSIQDHQDSGAAHKPRLVSVTTTREVASTHGAGWNIQHQGSRRLSKETVQLSVLVQNDDEANQLGHLELVSLITYNEVDEREDKEGYEYAPHQRNLKFEDPTVVAPLSGEPNLSCYRTVEETYDSMEALEEKYPRFVRVTDIGESWRKESQPSIESDSNEHEEDDGYDIKMMILSAPSDYLKHDMMIVAGHHSRELPPPELIMRWAEHLLASYGKDADVTWILERTNFHIVPIANPDGRAIVQDHLEWWYRKNAHPYGCSNGTLLEGVDLNRQYPFMWGYDSGSSGDPCSNGYRGPAALSEPESRAVYNYAHKLFGDEFKRGSGDAEVAMNNINASCSHETTGIFIDIHSSGDFVYFPYGFADLPAPDHRSLLTMASKLAQPGNFSLWGPGQDGFLYYVSGDSTDALYGIDCIPAFGYEIGSQFYANCTELDEDIVPIMYDSLLYAAKSVSAPYKIPLGPDLMDVCVDNTDPKRTTMTVSVSDEALIVEHTIYEEGDISQSIEKVQVFFDVHPYDAGSHGIDMEPLDGAFDSTEEEATYWLDTSSWEGQHVLYFQAKDSDGNVGPVTAVYVDNGVPSSCGGRDSTRSGGATTVTAKITSHLISESGVEKQESGARSAQLWSALLVGAGGLVGVLM